MNIKEFLKSIKFVHKTVLSIKKIMKRFIITLKYCIKHKCIAEKKEKELLILGTGPSLKNDIDSILKVKEKYDLMAVNSYCLDKKFSQLKPNYYVLADPCYFSNDVKGVGKKDRDVFIEAIQNDLNWKITLILPIEGKDSYLVKTLSTNEYISFEYINGNCHYLPFFLNKFKAYNKDIAMPWFQNVLQMCLYYAILKRFPTVYLFGADHNWCKDITVNTENVVCIEENHCYEKEHHKNHPIEKVDGTYWSMGELFDAWTKVYNGYYEINDYANYNKVKIFNSSSVSFIDAFERKQLV